MFSRLVDRVGFSMLAEVTQMAVGLVVFFTLAKRLELREIAFITTVTAFAALVGGLAIFGGSTVLMRDVGAGADFSRAFAKVTSTGTIGPLFGVALLLALRPWIIPELSFWVLGALLIGQMVLLWIVELCCHAAVAVGDMRLNFRMRLVTGLIRLVGLGGWLATSDQSLRSWSAWALAANAIGMIAALEVIRRRLGAKYSIRGATPRDFRTGIVYSLGISSEGVLDSSDRPVLLRIVGADVVGNYGFSGRVATLGVVPLIAVIKAYSADVFTASARGVASAIEASKRVAMIVVPMGFAIGVVLFLSAPLIPVLFGEKLNDAVPMLQALAGLPLIRGLQYVGGNILTATEYQGRRVAFTAAAGLSNLLLNLALIPFWSWKAAVGTTYAAEIGLTILCWWWVMRNRSPRDETTGISVAH